MISKDNTQQLENKYKLSEILLKRFEQFKKIDDSTKRFKRIIELGKKLPAFNPALQTEENQVKGCASLTYIAGELVEGKIIYSGDSNSHLVKGLVALLVEGLSNQSAQQILEVDPAFVEEMGLSQTLTASRANGFMNTYSMMMDIARKHA